MRRTSAAPKLSAALAVNWSSPLFPIFPRLPKRTGMPWSANSIPMLNLWRHGYETTYSGSAFGASWGVQQSRWAVSRPDRTGFLSLASAEALFGIALRHLGAHLT